MFNSSDIIQDEIITPLERCLSGEINSDAVNWGAVRAVARSFKMMKGWDEDFHKAMQPYYWRYLCGTLSGASNEAWLFINESVSASCWLIR